MAGKHLLEGLMKWATREPWAERFAEVLQGHVMPACEEKGIELDELAAILGEELFMSTVWACAFEDLLTREFENGSNIVDDYLKRRGWKESASVRAYITALRNSTMSLYEVSDIVRDKSYRARDLIRGGEPILISERSATHFLKPWDHIALRLVQVGSTTQMSGGALRFDHDTSEIFMRALAELQNLSDKDKREFAEATGMDFEEIARARFSPAEMLRPLNSMFTMYWLIDTIDRATGSKMPELHNAEGDQLLFYEVRYPFASGTTRKDIRSILRTRPEFRPSSETSWNWTGDKRHAPPPSATQRDTGKSLTIETTLEDGALSLGGLELEDDALLFSVNSERRWELGRALLDGMFGKRLGPPAVKTQTLEQLRASPDKGAPIELDISEQERCAIIHNQLDRHYLDVIEKPVAMLGGKSPRAAVKTAGGRIEVVNWLKMMENTTATADKAMASYDFAWLWAELGVSELRR